MQITSGPDTAVVNRAKDGVSMSNQIEKFNLPVEVVSVADDGSAKVRPLVSLGNLSNHEEYQARLQMDRLTMARAGRVAPKDFTFYYRRGLRKSGTVLLHACHRKEDGDLWFKRMDVLRERPTDFEVKVWQAASLSVLPPS